MDKLNRKLIMSKFFNKNKNTKPVKPPKPISKDTGFYETLVIKKKQPQPTKKDAEICKKMGFIDDLSKKRYMIPSQFPNITQAHSS